MVQGTGTYVGKSLITTALCRIFRQDGFKVAPFKAQNMSLNSAATPDGLEISRAQFVQAEACEIPPSADMNPVLLKPMGEMECQVVLCGKPIATVRAREYSKLKPLLWKAVCESLLRLKERFDIVVIEGAGSPAEVNLREEDIANMRVAKAAKAPVLLVGDIDKGGVLAWIVGTIELLPEDERRLVKGLVINKFRGDIELLKPGLKFLEDRTGKPVLGVVPYIEDIKIQEEDSVALELPKRGGKGEVRVAIVRLPHISNFTDFEPLEAEQDVSLFYVNSPEELEKADIIILPGTKNTIRDLIWLRERGFARKLLEARKKGKLIIGICGGFQMLGKRIIDPFGVESERGEIKGLGFLEAVTVFEKKKATYQVRGEVVADLPFIRRGEQVRGYEIHMGRTEGERFVFRLTRSTGGSVYDGMISGDGLVFGTYLHGIFDEPNFRRGVLNFVRRRKGLRPIEPKGVNPRVEREREYDRLARIVRRSLDIKAIYRMMGL